MDQVPPFARYTTQTVSQVFEQLHSSWYCLGVLRSFHLNRQRFMMQVLCSC